MTMVSRERSQSGMIVLQWNRVLNIAMAAVLSFAVSLILASPAFAEVRKADIIGDSTVDSLGLTVSECPNLECDYAILADSDGNVYFQRDAQTAAQIASITKVMTAIVACENVDPDTIITVSAKAASIGESSAGLQEGDKMDFDTALKALLVPSGNDAAVALAETVGAQMIEKDSSLGTDPQQVFVDAMNKKAASLGLKDTVYENPHGLDDDEFRGDLHSTAEDQLVVARYAMSISKIRNIVGGGSTTIIVQRGSAAEQIELKTTDGLLEMYSHTIGIKTGETLAAGPSFMGAANNGDIELYAIVLHSSDATQRFYDAKELFTWGYQHIIDIQLANSAVSAHMTVNGSEKQVPVLAEASLSAWTDKTVKVTLENPDEKLRVFDLFGNVSQTIQLNDISGSVKAGQRVGTITFKQHNAVIATRDLVACEDVAAPDFMQSVSIWWTRLTAGLTGAQTEAEDAYYATMPIVKDNTQAA